jgi:hypothetical protein
MKTATRSDGSGIAVARRGSPSKVQEHAYGNLAREAVRSDAMADALRAPLTALCSDDRRLSFAPRGRRSVRGKHVCPNGAQSLKLMYRTHYIS